LLFHLLDTFVAELVAARDELDRMTGDLGGVGGVVVRVVGAPAEGALVVAGPGDGLGGELS